MRLWALPALLAGGFCRGKADGGKNAVRRKRTFNGFFCWAGTGYTETMRRGRP